MAIGSRLEALMKEKHTNANELAQKIGVAPTTIYSMIKRDSKKADIDVLLSIAQALDVDVAYFGDASVHGVSVRDTSAEDAAASAQTHTVWNAETSYEEMASLIARNGKHMSASQKMRLIQLLSSLDEEES